MSLLLVGGEAVWFNDPLTDNDAGPFGGMKHPYGNGEQAKGAE